MVCLCCYSCFCLPSVMYLCPGLRLVSRLRCFTSSPVVVFSSAVCSSASHPPVDNRPDQSQLQPVTHQLPTVLMLLGLSQSLSDPRSCCLLGCSQWFCSSLVCFCHLVYYVFSFCFHCLVYGFLALPCFLFRPSIFGRLSEIGSRRQQVQERNLDLPLPSNTLQLLLGDPKAFPGQKGHIIPPTSPGSAPKPPPSGTCPKTFQGRRPGDILTRCPKQTAVCIWVLFAPPPPPNRA